MDFVEKLQTLAAEIRRKRRYAKNEAATRSYLVDPFIQTLGYNVQNPDDVEPEFTADLVSYSEKVDYALKQNGKPIILVEVKPATVSLTHEHTKQLQRYFSTKLDVQIGILTNGLECRFYSDLDKPNVMDDQPFLTINLQQIDGREAAQLNIFLKSEFDVDSALSAARKMKHKSRIENVVNEACNPLSDELVELFIRKAYSGKLTKSARAEFTPLVLEAWQEFLTSKADAKRMAQHGEPATKGDEKSILPRPSPNTPNPEGSVRLPIHIHYRPHGSKTKHRLHGTLILSDDIGRNQKILEYEGELLSPSEAGGRAIRSVNPGVSNPNGWVYWTFVNPNTGKDDVIDLLTQDKDLRRQLLRRCQM